MISTIFSLGIVIFSVAIHEASHALVAYKLGDPTAKYQGRISLNPVKHLDPIGSIVFPLLTLVLTNGKGPLLAWAKPVPINPYNFKDRAKGELKVALAGPCSNIILAIISGLLIRFVFDSGMIFYFLGIACITNFSLAIFNLFPVPPLDGFHILLNIFPEKSQQAKIFLQKYGFLVLFLLIGFGTNIISSLAWKAFYFVTGK